jgi:hypothetical protein
MAEPQKASASHPAHVTSCAATDCAHNKDHNCHAESVTVEIRGGSPVCGTYTTDEPRPRP